MAPGSSGGRPDGWPARGREAWRAGVRAGRLSWGVAWRLSPAERARMVRLLARARGDQRRLTPAQRVDLARLRGKLRRRTGA